MTVYVINNVIPDYVNKTICKYLKVIRVTYTYSDWLNDFGFFTGNKIIPSWRKRIIYKYLWHKLKGCSIKTLIECRKK